MSSNLAVVICCEGAVAEDAGVNAPWRRTQSGAKGPEDRGAGTFKIDTTEPLSGHVAIARAGVWLLMLAITSRVWRFSVMLWAMADTRPSASQSVSATSMSSAIALVDLVQKVGVVVTFHQESPFNDGRRQHICRVGTPADRGTLAPLRPAGR